jgi:hypothetical protein
LDIRDLKPFSDMICSINESYKITEEQLIQKCEKLDTNNKKEIAHSFLGNSYKRLCRKSYFTGEISRNNLEKEFVREWIYKNNQYSHNGKGENYLADHILGRQCSEEELITMSTVIQWLGTNVGMNFIEKVTKTGFTKNI